MTTDHGASEELRSRSRYVQPSFSAFINLLDGISKNGEVSQVDADLILRLGYVRNRSQALQQLNALEVLGFVRNGQIQDRAFEFTSGNPVRRQAIIGAAIDEKFADVVKFINSSNAEETRLIIAPELSPETWRKTFAFVRAASAFAIGGGVEGLGYGSQNFSRESQGRTGENLELATETIESPHGAEVVDEKISDASDNLQPRRKDVFQQEVAEKQRAISPGEILTRLQQRILELESQVQSFETRSEAPISESEVHDSARAGEVIIAAAQSFAAKVRGAARDELAQAQAEALNVVRTAEEHVEGIEAQAREDAEEFLARTRVEIDRLLGEARSKADLIGELARRQSRESLERVRSEADEHGRLAHLALQDAFAQADKIEKAARIRASVLIAQAEARITQEENDHEMAISIAWQKILERTEMEKGLAEKLGDSLLEVNLTISRVRDVMTEALDAAGSLVSGADASIQAVGAQWAADLSRHRDHA